MELEGGCSNNKLEGGYDDLEGGAVGGANGGARKRMYREKHCSPGENDVEGSCLDDDIVIKVAKAINRLANNNQKLDKIDLSRSPEDIHGDICAQISIISKGFY